MISKLGVQETGQIPSEAQQSKSGAQNAGTATGSPNSFRTPQNLAIPQKMVYQGQVRLATLRSVMGRNCLQILKNLALSEEQSRSIK